MNKKAVSEIVSYVLLIVIAITIATLVFGFLKVYVPKDKPECKDDINLIIEEVSCTHSAGENSVTITLENRGLFQIDRAFIRMGQENRKFKSDVPQTNPVSLPNTGASNFDATPLFYSGFESGEQGWNDGGDFSEHYTSMSIVDDDAMPGGSNSWHLQGKKQTSTLDQDFDFTGYDKVEINWFAFYNSIEGTEALELRCDSTNIVWNYQANTEGTEDQWLDSTQGQTFTLTSANCAFDSSVNLRFEAEFSGNGDHVYIDGINLTGYTATPAQDSLSPAASTFPLLFENLPSEIDSPGEYIIEVQPAHFTQGQDVESLALCRSITQKVTCA